MKVLLVRSATCFGTIEVARVKGERLNDAAHAGRFEPAVGAVFLALEPAGLQVDEPLLARLMSTLPPDTLLAT